MSDSPEIITREQADEAWQLVSDAACYPQLIETARLMQHALPDFLAMIREAHEGDNGICPCKARSEGLDCCTDILTADPGKYAPGKVAAAQELVARYRQQEAGRR